MTKSIFGLYGAGGFAREVMPLVVDYIALVTQHNSTESTEIYFVESEPERNEVNGYRLISEKDFIDINCEEKYFNIAIANSKVREEISKRCIKQGVKPFGIQAVNALTYDRCEIGEGAILCAHTMITSNVKIGKFFHSNIYSYVAHDCIIGDYVTFAPNVHCNGNVHIHDHAYIGTGAVIKQGSSQEPLVIGEGAIIGMGAVVTKDVAPFTTVVGNPARIHEK